MGGGVREEGRSGRGGVMGRGVGGGVMEEGVMEGEVGGVMGGVREEGGVGQEGRWEEE